jgi:hypothetical protein
MDLGSVSTGYSVRPVAWAIKIKHAGLNLAGPLKGKRRKRWVCFLVFVYRPSEKEKFMMKEKQQAQSNKLRHFVAGQFGKLTQSQASSNKLRHLVLFHKPGTKIKNRFRRKI